MENVTKRFGKVVANNAINLELHEGEILSLLGENGSGKTTLMNAVASAMASAVPSAATFSFRSVSTTEPVARVPVQSASMASPFMAALMAYS